MIKIDMPKMVTWEDSSEKWYLLATKKVMVDGEPEDYSWWFNPSSPAQHTFVLGDISIYNPVNDFGDWDCESFEEAKEWFESYRYDDEIEEDYEFDEVDDFFSDLDEDMDIQELYEEFEIKDDEIEG